MKALKTLLVALVLILVSLPSHAGEQTYTAGKGGMYYDAAGLQYTRKDNWTWVAPTSYTYCNRCYQTPGYWKFDGYSYTQVPLTSADPDWRTKLLDIAARRDEFEGKLRNSANEHNQFLEAVRELGLQGNFNWQAYGVAPALASPYRLAAVPFGIHGNTQYAYQTFANTTVADIYGGADANLLFQQAAALGKDSLAMAGQATDRFGILIDRERDRATRVAEILAVGQSADRALQAARPAASASITSTTTGTTPIPTGAQAQLAPRRLTAMRNCIQCHGDQNPQGGYRVSQHWALSQDDQLKVVAHLVADQRDPKFMPRNPAGGPGQRLPSSVILEFVPTEERAKVQ